MNSSVCPNCQGARPPGLESCPVCGAPSSTTRKAWRSWWLPLACLLAPALLTLLTAKVSDAASSIGLLGSGAAALGVGVWISRANPRRAAWFHILLWLLIVPAFGLLSLFLCCMGCQLGGGEFNVH